MAASVKTGAEGLFTDEKQSQFYKSFRPNPPSILISKIIDFTKVKLSPPFKRAVDVGCGSGQSTGVLAPYFEHVLGVDVSESQLNEGKKNEKNSNVDYKVASCDSIPVADESVELVTACTAAHWFHLPSFFKEVDRVLVPGGVVALYVYCPFPRPQDNQEELMTHLGQVYDVDLAEYWHENMKIAEQMYKTIELPYAESVRDDSVFEDTVWSVGNYLGLIQSWSGFRSLKKDHPDKAKTLISNLEKNLMKSLNSDRSPDETFVNVRWTYAILMGRK